MTDGRHRWLLEQDADGEVRTFPEATEQSISHALDTNYAALYDTLDESCVWCVGEPDRRIIEIRTFPDGRTLFTGLFQRKAWSVITRRFKRRVVYSMFFPMKC